MSEPEPKTVAERLDAARDGEEFLGVLTDLFAALDCQIGQADRELDQEHAHQLHRGDPMTQSKHHDDLRTRIAAVLAAEFDGQARKFDDAGWEGVADAVIRELKLREDFSYPPSRRRYVTEWETDA